MSTAPPTLVQYLQNQRLILDFVFIAAVAAFVYDYLLTLHLEIKLIWLSPWNYTKIIFLVFRYMPFIQIWVTLQNQTFLNVSIGSCRVSFPLEG